MKRNGIVETCTFFPLHTTYSLTQSRISTSYPTRSSQAKRKRRGIAGSNIHLIRDQGRQKCSDKSICFQDTCQGLCHVLSTHARDCLVFVSSRSPGSSRGRRSKCQQEGTSFRVRDGIMPDSEEGTTGTNWDISMKRTVLRSTGV